MSDICQLLVSFPISSIRQDCATASCLVLQGMVTEPPRSLPSQHCLLLPQHPSTKKYDLSSVRFLLMGAAPISAELTKQLLKVFPGICLGQGYGVQRASLLSLCLLIDITRHDRDQSKHQHGACTCRLMSVNDQLVAMCSSPLRKRLGLSEA